MFLSVITVCYNSARTIRQTFDSVLQQDFDDYEYIVVDGLSSDGTLEKPELVPLSSVKLPSTFVLDSKYLAA